MDKAKEIVLRKCANELEFLGRVISPQTYYLPTPPFHKEIDEVFMDSSIIQSVIEAPRDSAKSTKAVNKIIHHVTFDKGDKLVVIQSKTRPEAINRLTKIKNILEYSDPYKELFGYCGEQTADVWREDKITTIIGGYRVTIKALGTGMMVRGALEDDTRITLYILDDPDDENSCITKEQMEKNFDRFLGGVAGLDRRNGRVIVIGTPIREGCIVERLRGATGWTTLHYKCTVNAETHEVLWPEKYTWEWLQTKKTELTELGKLSKYYSEYECEIMGDEDRLFKNFKYWDGDFELRDGKPFLIIKKLNKIELPEPKIIPVNVFIGIDPASSTKHTADFSVTFPIAYDVDENIYVLDYYRRRVNPMTHAEQIIESFKQLKPTRAHPETVAYQEFLRVYLRQRMIEEDIYIPGLETKITPRTEKSARLDTLQPFFGRGRVHIKEGQTALEDELRMYPRGRNDDLMDGLFFATMKLFPPVHMDQTQNELDDLRYFVSVGGRLQRTTA